jgi:hypothetical protein
MVRSLDMRKINKSIGIGNEDAKLTIKKVNTMIKRPSWLGKKS